MIDKAVAKLTGFGPQGARTENRGQTGESANATALARLFQTHLSTIGGKAEATAAAFFQGDAGYGQAEPPSRDDYDDHDYVEDRPEPTPDEAAAAGERRDRPHDSATDAPREPARSDDGGGRDDAAAAQEERADASAHDGGGERDADEGEEPATAQEVGDTGGGSREASSGGDDEGTGPVANGETTNAAPGTPAANGVTAQTAAATTATTATTQVVGAQVVGSSGATQGAGNAAPAGKAQQPQGQASDTGKQATTVATAGEAPKTGNSNAGNHGLGGDQANARQQQMPGNAGKPAEAPKQASDPQARARQGEAIAQAIGRAGEGSKVEVKVSTDVRGAGRGPTAAGPQDAAAASGGNARPGSQAGGGNQQTAQAQLAQQQAAQQQAQVSQQVQPQNQQAGQSQGRGGPVATSPAAAASAAVSTTGSAASHALQGGGEGGLQTASAGGQAQSSQQSQSSAHTQAAQPQRAAQGGQAVADQVSVKITKAVQAGQDRIHIQLKPAELGRVDVRIEMTHDGRAVTIVTADKADTLDLLRRDSEQLQKALADAGLETGSGDLSFNLRGEGREGEEPKDTGAGSQLAGGDDAAGDEAQPGDDGVMLALDSGILMPGRVDLRA